MRTRLRALLAVLVLAAAAATPSGGQPAADAPATIAEGGNEFGIELYRRLGEQPGNIFVSPVSISTAFGLAIAGARGETAEEIARTLRYPGAGADLHPQMAALLDQLRTEQAGRRLTVANSVWVQRDFAIRPEYAALTRDHYGAPPAQVDFVGRPTEAAAAINRWVERNTAGLIRDLIEPGTIDRLTRLILTNAVYFKGDWANPFSAGATRPDDFHAVGGVRRVPFMHEDASFPYLEGDGFQAISLAYAGGEFSMDIFLPRERDRLAAFERSVTPERLRDWLGQLHRAEPRYVLVALPKLEMRAKYQLPGVLQAMGMVAPFAEGRADFSGIADADLLIDEVIHQTYLRIDEKGTEAAAATAIEIRTTSARPDPILFRADHPFFFVIRHNPTGSLVFLGRIATP